MTETFAQRLRRLRDEKGMTVADLAAASRCAEGTLRHLEGGDVKSPNLLLGVRIADALNVSARYLAIGEESSTVERFETLERRIETVERGLAHLQRGR